ncbi:hypothetical protein QOT17_013737 [Balamuthia mandrillaris]
MSSWFGGGKPKTLDYTKLKNPAFAQAFYTGLTGNRVAAAAELCHPYAQALESCVLQKGEDKCEQELTQFTLCLGSRLYPAEFESMIKCYQQNQSNPSKCETYAKDFEEKLQNATSEEAQEAEPPGTVSSTDQQIWEQRCKPDDVSCYAMEACPAEHKAFAGCMDSYGGKEEAESKCREKGERVMLCTGRFVRRTASSAASSLH